MRGDCRALAASWGDIFATTGDFFCCEQRWNLLPLMYMAAARIRAVPASGGSGGSRGEDGGAGAFARRESGGANRNTRRAFSTRDLTARGGCI